MKRIFLILCIAALLFMISSASAVADSTVANFTANTTSGTAPLTVQFTDISANATSWAWDFNHDGKVDSTEQNPVHTYSKTDTYSVNLNVMNAVSSDSTVKTDYVTVEGTGTFGLADTPWPTFQRDFNNTGRSPYKGPQTNNKIWSYTTGKYVYNSPVIGIDGTIYIGSIDKKIYALNRDGTLKWTYTTKGDIYGASTIGSDGTIYSTSYDGNLYALNSDGTLKWSYPTRNIYGSPAIGKNGTIYIGSYNCNLYALNSDGTLKWTYKTDSNIYNSPAIGKDGTIYFGSYNTNLYALNPDGSLKWSYNIGGTSQSSPTIGSDGTIYIGSHDKKVYALNSDGTLKWTYTTGNSIVSSPAVGSDGTIYIGSNDKKVYALNPDGTLKWSYTTRNYISSSPAIGSDGTIYFGSGDKKVYALNPDGTLKWSYTTGNVIQSSPAIGSDGTLYIGSNDYKLYAFRDASTVAPVANFTSKITTGTDGYIPQTVQFTDTSSYLPTSWTWDFGDGTSSNQQDPFHTYTASGTYTVNLTASNSIGSDFEVKTAYITVTAPPAPSANFTAFPTSGDIPLSVQFTDQSTGIGLSWAWDFDNDGTIDSMARHPLHVYNAAGTYTVNLSVTNAGGSDNEIKTNYITVAAIAAPAAGFTATPMSGYTPMTVQFNDTSTGLITFYEWDFNNDGNIDSTDKNVSYTYSTAGTYTVNHTVTGYGGSSSSVQPDLIKVIGAPELFVSSVSSDTNYPLFNNTLTATILNEGAGHAGGFNVTFFANGINKTVTVSGLGAGNSTTVSTTDIKRYAGDTVLIKVIVDPENTIAEANEENNEYSTTATITATGERYQGGRFSTGKDTVNTAVYAEGNIGVRVVEYGSYTWFTHTGTATYTADDLKIPANATLKSARLYQDWTWYPDPHFTIEFNGHDRQNPDVVYIDKINGQYVFDVTPYFKVGGNNTAVISAERTQRGYYGTVLVVVYEDASEPYRQIWVNEGCDCLLYGTEDPYVGYTVIDNVSTTDLLSADVTAILPSGENADLKITFNQKPFSMTGSDKPDPSFHYYDVTNAVQNGTNELGIKGHGEDYFNYALSIVEMTRLTASEANFVADIQSGNAPLVVNFTDTSTGTPTSWEWDFGDGKTSNEQNPTHTYTAEGNYTVKLTVSNSLGSDSEEKTGYINVGSAILSPVAEFSSDITSGNAPLTIQFK
ncbi:hypothetical protein EO94_10270, partial [Methanosarcina sp. 2.H.T.1A.3]|uniref:PKD domain-containing protein n=1 Tax=Methanosarcina sp. 2.H.T.1A.3 TaxID=1483597 RepID=UPI000620FF45